MTTIYNAALHDRLAAEANTPTVEADFMLLRQASLEASAKHNHYARDFGGKTSGLFHAVSSHEATFGAFPLGLALHWQTFNRIVTGAMMLSFTQEDHLPTFGPSAEYLTKPGSFIVFGFGFNNPPYLAPDHTFFFPSICSTPVRDPKAAIGFGRSYWDSANTIRGIAPENLPFFMGVPVLPHSGLDLDYAYTIHHEAWFPTVRPK